MIWLGEKTVTTEFGSDHFVASELLAVISTAKSARLTGTERDNVQANAVLALRMSILSKRLGLSLRKFSLALSHSDLYKWFCGINRFYLPKVPGKSTVGELENSIPSSLTKEIEKCLLRATDSCQILDEPLDFSRSYFDCTCIRANIYYPTDWVLLRDSTRTLMKATARIHKIGLLIGCPTSHLCLSLR